MKNNNIRKIFIGMCLLVFLTACTNQPQFDTLTYNSDYTLITSPDGRSWQIKYEKNEASTYDGVVRHNSLWMDNSAPFMSNDVLVTTRDFADAEITRTMVFQHKFFYRTNRAANGRINLIHALPATQEIYDELQQIKRWDHVILQGREILIINIFDENGDKVGYFKDMGCNTLLVTKVTILDPVE